MAQCHLFDGAVHGSASAECGPEVAKKGGERDRAREKERGRRRDEGREKKTERYTSMSQTRMVELKRV